MRFDLNEVSALLHIHEKAMGHPKLKPLADAAMKHLEAMAEETAKPEPEPEAWVDTGEGAAEPVSDEDPPAPATTIRRL
jgi:hypothetical protein